MKKQILIEKYKDLVRLKDKKIENKKEIQNFQENKNLKIKKVVIKRNSNIYKSLSTIYNKVVTILRIRPENEEEINYSNINIINIKNQIFLKLLYPLTYNFYKEGTKYLNDKKGIEVTSSKSYNFMFDYI